jgi:hypothetical protein
MRLDCLIYTIYKNEGECQSVEDDPMHMLHFREPLSGKPSKRERKNPSCPRKLSWVCSPNLKSRQGV